MTFLLNPESWIPVSGLVTQGLYRISGCSNFNIIHRQRYCRRFVLRETQSKMEIEKYGNNNYVNWSIDDDGRAGEI